jgi:hypothetical protein
VKNELIIGTHGRSIWVLDINQLLEKWPADQSWVEAAPNAVQLDTLVAITWRESWGERGWSWQEPAAISARIVKCYSTKSESGTWLVEDSSGQQLTLVDSMILQRGWQHVPVPMKISGSPDYLTKGNYPLIWKSQSGEKRTRLSVRTGEEGEQ